MYINIIFKLILNLLLKMDKDFIQKKDRNSKHSLAKNKIIKNGKNYQNLKYYFNYIDLFSISLIKNN